MDLLRPLWTGPAHLLIVLALAMGVPVGAQPSQFEGRQIATIQFVPREQPLEASALNDMLPLKIKTPLEMSTVRASIERLYATGRYADIQVEAEPHGSEVVIRFHTKNSWFVGHVGVSGNLSDPPNAGQLANATRLELGQPFREARVESARGGITQLLESNGLYNGSVHPEYEYDTNTQQVHIRFVVDSGRRASFSQPVFQGELKMSPRKLTTATKWRRWIIHTWKPVTQVRVRNGLDGLRDLYQKDNRLEAKISLKEMPYDVDTNRVRPLLEINAGPRIQVRTIGVKLSTKKLQQYVPVYEEHTVDHELLVEGQRNLRDYFQSGGYFDAEVVFKQQRVANDKADIDYLVNRGTRHRLVHVEIDGNKYFTREAIRERMFVTPASWLQFRHGRYSENLLRSDEDSIDNLYHSNGFRDVAVTSRIADDYKGKDGDIAVYVTIKEGAQYFVGTLTIDGIEHLDRKLIEQQFSSAEGQPFSEYNVAIDRDTILAQYFANGYPNATFEWSSKPGAQPNFVDLRFLIGEGEPRYVRQVLINGLKTTRPSLVYRNLLLNPGDPLSPTRMSETQRRLYDLGVFAKVDMAIQNQDGETTRKYVLYDMEEARRYSLAAGVGAEVARIGGGCQTCLDNPGGATGFAPRVSLDAARLNFLGLGHSISMRTRLSTLERRALLNYSAPRFRNREGLALSFTGLYDDSRDVRTFSAKRVEGSVQLSQRFSKATTFFYRYTYRRVSVDESTLKITPFLIPLLSQPVRIGIVTGNMIQDRRDDPVEPRKGIYNTLDFGLAEHAFGSQRNFFRFLGRNATYHPLTKKLTLARNTSFGAMDTFRFTGDPLQAIPLAERFFAGGGTSHRGFPENQAGPRDTITGFPLGGTALIFNQTELRFPLIGENIGGVFFHDAGNVYSSLRSHPFRLSQKGNIQDFDYLEQAVGFGVRYRTPIGPVRVDLAYSVNPPSFIGFKGTTEDLLNAGRNPCDVAGRCVPQNVSHFQFFFSIGQTF